MGTGMGSLRLDRKVVSSKYLLLHTKNDKNSGRLFKITSEGPKVYSKDDLIRKEYPSPPSQNHYLVIDVELVEDTEFKDVVWEFNKLSDYKSSYSAGIPFAVSLTELMKHKVK